MLTTVGHGALFYRKGQLRISRENFEESKVDPGMVSFHVNLTGLRGAQRAAQMLSSGVCAKVFLEEMSF